MRFEISKINVKAGKSYRGWVIDNRIDHDKLYIYVELDKCPGTKFLKVVPIDLNPQSVFCKLARSLELFDDEGYIETDYLKGLAVIASLQKGNDSVLYVNHLELDEEYYQQLFDENDDGVDDDEIYYGDGEE